MTDVIEVLHYQTADGRIPFRECLNTMTDPDTYSANQGRIDPLARAVMQE